MMQSCVGRSYVFLLYNYKMPVQRDSPCHTLPCTCLVFVPTLASLILSRVRHRISCYKQRLAPLRAVDHTISTLVVISRLQITGPMSSTWFGPLEAVGGDSNYTVATSQVRLVTDD